MQLGGCSPDRVDGAGSLGTPPRVGRERRTREKGKKRAKKGRPAGGLPGWREVPSCACRKGISAHAPQGASGCLRVPQGASGCLRVLRWRFPIRPKATLSSSANNQKNKCNEHDNINEIRPAIRLLLALNRIGKRNADRLGPLPDIPLGKARIAAPRHG